MGRQKTLVTGGAGFIGSHVVKQLLARGEQVRVLHLPNENLFNLKGLDVELVAGDVLDKTSVDQVVRGCDRIYHLAAVYAFWMKDPQKMFDVNIDGSRNIFEAAITHGIKRLVYTSSMVRFGGQGHQKGHEGSPFVLGKTGELYSISKYQSHELAVDYANKGLDIRIVCPTLPLGPGDIAPTPTGRYLIRIAQQPAMFYTGTFTNIGDVRDIAAGHLLAMDNGSAGRSYILGGHEDISMRDFCELIRKKLHRKTPLIPISDSAFEALGYAMEMTATFITGKAPIVTSQAARASSMGLRADCSRAVDELGYNCRSLEESIEAALVWFSQNGYL